METKINDVKEFAIGTKIEYDGKSYKVIEKVLKRDETNTTEVLDEHKVKIHNTIMNICAQIAGVTLGISIAELIIKRKEFKDNNMEIDNDINFSNLLQRALINELGLNAR